MYYESFQMRYSLKYNYVHGHENINIVKDIWNNVGSLASLLNKFMTTQNGTSLAYKWAKLFGLTRRGLCYIYLVCSYTNTFRFESKEIMGSLFMCSFPHNTKNKFYTNYNQEVVYMIAHLLKRTKHKR